MLSASACAVSVSQSLLLLGDRRQLAAICGLRLDVGRGCEMWESDSERQESELCVESTGPRCGVLVICVILFLKSQFSVKSVHTWLSRFYHERRCFDSFQLNPVLGLVEYIKDIGVIHILSKYEPFPPNYLTHLPLVWKCSFSSLQTDYLLQQELSLQSFI